MAQQDISVVERRPSSPHNLSLKTPAKLSGDQNNKPTKLLKALCPASRLRLLSVYALQQHRPALGSDVEACVRERGTLMQTVQRTYVSNQQLATHSALSLTWLAYVDSTSPTVTPCSAPTAIIALQTHQQGKYSLSCEHELHL